MRLRTLVMFVLLLGCAACARAGSVYLEDLTWTELRDAIRAGSTTVIVPAGGTEQNGPHMTLGKHNARARLLAGRIAEANRLRSPVASSMRLSLTRGARTGTRPAAVRTSRSLW